MRRLAAGGYLGVFILVIGCTDNSPPPDQSREGVHRPVLTVSTTGSEMERQSALGQTTCGWRFWPGLLQ